MFLIPSVRKDRFRTQHTVETIRQCTPRSGQLSIKHGGKIKKRLWLRTDSPLVGSGRPYSALCIRQNLHHAHESHYYLGHGVGMSVRAGVVTSTPTIRICHIELSYGPWWHVRLYSVCQVVFRFVSNRKSPRTRPGQWAPSICIVQLWPRTTSFLLLFWICLRQVTSRFVYTPLIAKDILHPRCMPINEASWQPGVS